MSVLHFLLLHFSIFLPPPLSFPSPFTTFFHPLDFYIYFFLPPPFSPSHHLWLAMLPGPGKASRLCSTKNDWQNLENEHGAKKKIFNLSSYFSHFYIKIPTSHKLSNSAFHKHQFSKSLILIFSTTCFSLFVREFGHLGTVPHTATSFYLFSAVV